MALPDLGQAGANAALSGLVVPYYGEAMTLLGNWERDGEDFEWIITRLYQLWNAAPGSAGSH